MYKLTILTIFVDYDELVHVLDFNYLLQYPRK